MSIEIRLVPNEDCKTMRLASSGELAEIIENENKARFDHIIDHVIETSQQELGQYATPHTAQAARTAARLAIEMFTPHQPLEGEK